MAGYFLMLLYGRLRFLHGQRITGMRLELVHVDSKPVGFLECAAERTKTSISLERKVRFLPIALNTTPGRHAVNTSDLHHKKN